LQNSINLKDQTLSLPDHVYLVGLNLSGEEELSVPDDVSLQLRELIKVVPTWQG